MNQMWNNANISEKNTFHLAEHDKSSENTLILIGCTMKINVWCSDWNCTLKFFWMSLQVTLSLLMPSKCHSSLQLDLSFSHTSGRLHMRKKIWTCSLGERWHQTHSCSTATTTGVWRDWSQSVLAGLYRKGDSVQYLKFWCLPLLVKLQGVYPGSWMLFWKAWMSR